MYLITALASCSVVSHRVLKSNYLVLKWKVFFLVQYILKKHWHKMFYSKYKCSLVWHNIWYMRVRFLLMTLLYF